MKNLRKIMAVLLALLMVLALSACAKSASIPAGKTTVGVKDGETLGQGKTTFTVEVTDAQGAQTSFTVTRGGARVRPVIQRGHRHHGGLRRGRYLLGVLCGRPVCPHRRGHDGCSGRRGVRLRRGENAVKHKRQK